MSCGEPSWNFLYFKDYIFFDILEVVAKNRKKRIMHFWRLANEQAKVPGGKTSWNFHNFLEEVCFDIIEVLAKNRKYVLCIFGGWPMDQDENASGPKILNFSEISWNGLFHHNRGPDQKPKNVLIMRFRRLSINKIENASRRINKSENGNLRKKTKSG